MPGISPSATASSTPWAMPSWPAPQVIFWCSGSIAVALLIMIVGGHTGS